MLAVLVPVLNRPQNVPPLVESFLAGCPTGSKLFFLAHSGDKAEWAACMEAADEERVFLRHPGNARTWPQKINKGVTLAWSDWYLCAADDITFQPGWWGSTEALRQDPTVGVIGTNDSATGQGNPGVAAGEHTCHPLIRASYIKEQGTIDQPGKAVHDGYHHWFVDNELVLTAQRRNAWAFCKEAVIEHHHPYWDSTITWDDTYAKGESRAAEDQALFISRMAEHFDIKISFG